MDADAIILKSITQFNTGLPPHERLTDVSPEMRFIGHKSPGHRILDSMGMVDLMFQVEDVVMAETGVDINLADERLLRQEKSPLRSFRALSDYVGELLSE